MKWTRKAYVFIHLVIYSYNTFLWVPVSYVYNTFVVRPYNTLIIRSIQHPHITTNIAPLQYDQIMIDQLFRFGRRWCSESCWTGPRRRCLRVCRKQVPTSCGRLRSRSRFLSLLGQLHPTVRARCFLSSCVSHQLRRIAQHMLDECYRLSSDLPC